MFAKKISRFLVGTLALAMGANTLAVCPTIPKFPVKLRANSYVAVIAAIGDTGVTTDFVSGINTFSSNIGAGINFYQVYDYDTGGVAMIEVVESTDAATSNLKACPPTAYACFVVTSLQNDGSIGHAYLVLNKFNFVPGAANYSLGIKGTVLHEGGHGLGLGDITAGDSLMGLVDGVNNVNGVNAFTPCDIAASSQNYTPPPYCQ